MFTRIHVLKFQNKVAKDSLKNTCRLINDKLLKRGLYSSTFVDVNDTNLYVINTWKDEKTSDKAHSQYTDFVKQVKEMGVNVVIVGGDTEVIYSDPSILQKYTKVDNNLIKLTTCSFYSLPSISQKLILLHPYQQFCLDVFLLYLTWWIQH